MLLFKLSMKKYFFFFLGLTLYSFGSALAVQVKYLGLHPWDVLNVALYEHFGLTIGTWSLICGLILVVISFFVDRKYISLGTFLNALFIGPVLDLFLKSHLLPAAQHNWIDYLIMLSGIVISGIGGGIYVAAGIGAGPRDGFMLSISDKIGLSVSKARIIVESTVLLLGFLLQGPVYIVSFFYTFILSPVFQKSLLIFRNILQTEMKVDTGVPIKPSAEV